MVNHFSSSRTWQLFVVEDSPGDIVILREALQEAGLHADCEVAPSGEQALMQLRARFDDRARPPPDLILLDLNIPSGSGLDLLQIVKADAGLRHLPVLVLSTSASERDVMESCRLHANAYLQKPLEFQPFVQMLKAVHEFWARIALPVPKASASA